MELFLTVRSLSFVITVLDLRLTFNHQKSRCNLKLAGQLNSILDDINRMMFPPRGEGLLLALESVFKIIALELNTEQRSLLRQDFDFYSKKGKYLVHNTFAGGIIFLREPETINRIKIEFDSMLNETVVCVEYASEKRNARNVKYKPDAGQIESIKWKMLAVFPNFNKYSAAIKNILVAMIGKIVQCICEHYRKNSWFMLYEKEFEIELFLDGKIAVIYPVTLDD